MKASLMMLEASHPRCVCFCFLYCLAVTQRKTVCRNPAALFHHNPSGTGEQHLYDAPYLSYGGIACGIFFFSVAAGILLLLVNYVIFTVYDRMGQAAELQSRNRLYEQQLDLCSHQAEEREGILSGTASDAA